MHERKTPRDLLAAAGKLDKDVIAVKHAGHVVDLHTPIDASPSELTPIRATDAEGLAVIRHSTAHVMADAVQRLFPGTKVTIGPAIEDGFYYDFDKPGPGFSEEDLVRIEQAMLEIIKKDTPFRRVVVTRDEAKRMFSAMGETYKVEIIDAIPPDEEVSLYKHGGSASATSTTDAMSAMGAMGAMGATREWVDVCEGPHVPSTGHLRAIKLTHAAGAYWRGDERNPMLQRIYGTAFPSASSLDEHLKLLEQAKQRDHRKLGKELELFMFDEVAPAMPFFLPRGAFVYNKMIEYLRGLYPRYGYEEVITPLAYDPRLFRQSGHLGHYNENMYRLWTEDGLEGAGDALKGGLQAASFALKPMNCPSHCVIFGSKRRSYRELPWRVADFARLHRYERGGVVHGLARVRSFSQDDAHVFCTEGQVAEEIGKFIGFLNEVYRAFRFEKLDIKLATRPPADQRFGSDAEWDKSEAALARGLERVGLPYDVSPGEGAFYGPKVEFHVQDALKRSWQLGTIQYDWNMPARFELGYVGEDGHSHAPVMLHRAIFGSLERFFGVYLEHCGGNFPTWIAPKQAIVLTVSEKSDEYARRVVERLLARGLRIELDLSADKLGAKIRNARLLRYPYMLVVGPKEAESDSVGVRSRDAGELGAMKVDELAARLVEESASP
ncbi:MAG: threonine--tRNA ligase [Myxococcota bacterium]|nr:threonine--tRNA ligase [Myxococcota bacterium]